MFAKLMKYEFRATRKAMGVLCLTALLAGVLGGCSMAWLGRTAMMVEELEDTMDVLCGLVLTFSIFFIAMCGVGAFVLMVWRFYRSRFLDEGYLTFTLPVNGHQILLSSLLNSAVNMILATVVVILSYGIIAAIGCSSIEGFWAGMAEWLPRIWDTVRSQMTGEYWGYVTMVLLNVLTGFAAEMVTIMLAITMGAVAAKKHKILTALAIYYGIHMALSFLSATALTTGMIASNSVSGSFTVLLTGSALLSTAVSVAGYFLTHWLITRKLNLP